MRHKRKKDLEKLATK
uniref:Uncharacterized protein n=1 Tax=Anguilla anguilla TaxID=7936 RepID=A0A0E9V722_ANGAN